MADTPNPMHDFGFDKGQGLEFGIYTLGDHLPNPNDGSRVSTKERVHEVGSIRHVASLVL